MIHRCGHSQLESPTMPKGAAKQTDKAAGKKPANAIAKSSRKPKDAEKAKHAGKMMQMSKTIGYGGYAGSKEAIQHHAGKTLAASMGSKKQSELSAGVAHLMSGGIGSSMAQTGVFQMLAVKAHKGTLEIPAASSTSSQGKLAKAKNADSGSSSAFGSTSSSMCSPFGF